MAPKMAVASATWIRISHQCVSWLRHCSSPTTIWPSRRTSTEAPASRFRAQHPAAAPEQREEHEECDPEGRRDAHVDVDGGLEIAEARDVLATRVRPGRGHERAGDDEREQERHDADSEPGEPPRDEAFGPSDGEPVRPEQDDDGERDRQEREEEVPHHDQRVQLGEHGDPAQDPLGEDADGQGDRADEQAPREALAP